MLKNSGYTTAVKAIAKLSNGEVSGSARVTNENQTGNQTERLCLICRSMPQKYVCPRCNVPYCSLSCYKSPAHSNCSEAFYRDCVIEEMKISPVDPNPTKEILERAYKMSQRQELDLDDIFDDSLSSSDEEFSDSGGKQLES